MSAIKTYRVVKTDGDLFGVTIDGELENDGFESKEEALEEARRLRRYDKIADFREKVGARVDSLDGDDSAEAVAKLRKALKILSA